jgi:hypothetical protein
LGPVNSEGTAGPAGLSGTILGVPIILDGGVDPDTAIVTNSTAAKWGEDGPRTMTADVPSKLGRDVAIYGYGAPLVYIPAGVKVIKEAP